jgi:hypothetical protein
MAGESMDIEVAEKQLKSLEHSEQHYFNRQAWLCPNEFFFCCAFMLTFCAPAITTMVRGNPLLIYLPKSWLTMGDPAIRHP